MLGLTIPLRNLVRGRGGDASSVAGEAAESDAGTPDLDVDVEDPGDAGVGAEGISVLWLGATTTPDGVWLGAVLSPPRVEPGEVVHRIRTRGESCRICLGSGAGCWQQISLGSSVRIHYSHNLIRILFLHTIIPCTRVRIS